MTQVSKRHMVHKRIVLVFLALAFGVLCSMTPSRVESHKIHKIVLDAGHGGKDPGNLGTGRYKTTEKDITLDVTLRLGKYIEENFPEIEVIYTRDKDSFPSLNDRVVTANDANADLFISIHCDAFTKKSAHGSGTFVMGMHKTDESLRVAMQENASIYKEENFEQNYQGFDPADPDTYIALTLRQNVYLEHSLALSEKIQDQFRDRVGRVDRGVRQAGYYVICFTTMPSALVELGFLTNNEEEDYLNSEKGKSYMASAIYRAFKEYKKEIELIEIVVVDEKHEPDLVDSTPKSINDNLVSEKIKNGVSFEVQILTSSAKLEKNASDFLGVTEVKEYKINGMYKYTAGASGDYKKTKKNQDLLRSHGFTGAFMIAVKDGERIDLREALNQTN